MADIDTIAAEMRRGNYSFAILVVGALTLAAAITQIALLIKNRKGGR